MTPLQRRLLLWVPRILGILVTLFIGMFALDGLQEGVLAFLLHLLPAFVLLLVVFGAWHREWIGAAFFIGLALVYAVSTLRRPDWILVIAGPLLVVGLLFLWSWRHHDELRA